MKPLMADEPGGVDFHANKARNLQSLHIGGASSPVRELEVTGTTGTTQLVLTVLSAAPAAPENGMIAYADGTNWNPGGGAGVYAYVSGAWTKL
jgi:hypothetical protein